MKAKHFHLISTPIFAVLGRIGGVILPLFIAFYFGAGPTTDAFFFAFSLIMALAGLFTPFFESLLIPYLAEYKGDSKKISSFLNAMLLLAMPSVLFLAMVVAFFLTSFLKNFSGFESETTDLIARYFFEMLPVFFAWVLASAGSSIFFTNKFFWYPAISPMIRTLTAVAFLILGHEAWQMHAVTYGLALGEIIRLVVAFLLLIFLFGWKPVLDFHLVKENVRKFLEQAGYQLIALLALNGIPLTDQWFASWFGTGSLSLISYADRLFQIPLQLAMSGFLQVFLSYWSESYIQDHPERFWKMAKKDIRNVFWLSVTLSVLFIIFRNPLIALLYGRGDLHESHLRVLSELFAWLVVGFAPAVMNLLYVRVLYVIKKSSIFCIQSLIRFFMNIVLNALFIRIWGLQGIAMATAVVFVGGTAWMHFYLEQYWKKRGLHENRAG